MFRICIWVLRRWHLTFLPDGPFITRPTRCVLAWVMVMICMGSDLFVPGWQEGEGRNSSPISGQELINVADCLSHYPAPIRRKGNPHIDNHPLMHDSCSAGREGELCWYRCRFMRNINFQSTFIAFYSPLSLHNPECTMTRKRWWEDGKWSRQKGKRRKRKIRRKVGQHVGNLRPLYDGG